ncbi:MAG: SUMF1/EgtB/PvdO family nonheme iron enzyme [Acidobacteriota bacterium]|nr:SUMF1/EgtB/PvdO family nonheme iron enzyme [Acidobacteriota bacterium]
MPVLEATSNLLAELEAIRAESDRFFAILTPEALYERPIVERHRVIFYVGHLESFDSIQLCRERLGLPSPEPDLDALFQAGIDPDSSSLPSDVPGDWPSFKEARAYVARCRKHVDENLARVPEDGLSMIIEHRQMHLETLAYMLHNFDYRLKQVSSATPLEQTGRPSPPNSWIEIPAGEAILGKADDGTFGWDNEYWETRRMVPAFRIQKNSVSNGDYMQFVKAGAALPRFWIGRGDEIYLRGMFEEVPLPLDWPVYVTQTEAAAYANWIGKSIPTEQQFDRAAYGGRPGRQPYPWGNSSPSPRHGNFDFKRWDPEPVDANSSGESAFGVNQLVGNGWQWTSSVFEPLPGFTPSTTYPGYSANFFDGEHNIIKGGSPRTAARLLRRSFRNWFRRDYPYVDSTFRCVEN